MLSISSARDMAEMEIRVTALMVMSLRDSKLFSGCLFQYSSILSIDQVTEDLALEGHRFLNALMMTRGIPHRMKAGEDPPRKINITSHHFSCLHEEP